MSEHKFSFQKLNNENYFIWKYRMEMLLIKEGVWGYVAGGIVKLEPITSLWISKDDEARATIALSVEDNQIQHIKKYTTSKDAWNALKVYHERNTLGNKVQLMRQICGLRLDEGGNVEAHITNMNCLFEWVAAIGEERLSEQWSVAMLLSSLPRSYDTLIIALETREELSFDCVQSKLREEYRRNKQGKKNSC